MRFVSDYGGKFLYLNLYLNLDWQATVPTVLTSKLAQVQVTLVRLHGDSSNCPDLKPHRSQPKVRSLWSVYMETVPTVLTSNCIKAGPKAGYNGLFTWRQFQLSWPQAASKQPEFRSAWSIHHGDSSNCPDFKPHQSRPEVRSIWSMFKWRQFQLSWPWATPRSGHFGPFTMETVPTVLTSSHIKAGPRSGQFGLFR
jgi:hypothetical protein